MVSYLFVCPNGGGEVRQGAPVCPHCGSDENTGWSSQTYMDGIDLAETDFDEVLKRDYGVEMNPPFLIVGASPRLLRCRPCSSSGSLCCGVRLRLEKRQNVNVLPFFVYKSDGPMASWLGRNSAESVHDLFVESFFPQRGERIVKTRQAGDAENEPVVFNAPAGEQHPVDLGLNRAAPRPDHVFIQSKDMGAGPGLPLLFCHFPDRATQCCTPLP